MNVLCFAESAAAMAELLAGARGAAADGKVHAVMAGADGASLIAAGADVVHDLSTPDTNPGTLAKGLAALATSAGVNVVLISATKRGKSFAGLVASHFDAPYAAEISALKFEGGKPVATRMLLSGNTNGVLSYDHERLVATANPKTWEPLAVDSGRTGETQAASFEAGSTVTLVKVHAHEGEALNLSAAKIVVGAGRGIKKKEDLSLITDLAASLGGAVGCSRPIAADLKWLGEEHWIGLSGNEIKPRLYVACGISGQIQHLTGCRGSKTIVAINTDEDAPIFENADYGIVGDVYDVLPKLTELVKAAKS